MRRKEERGTKTKLHGKCDECSSTNRKKGRQQRKRESERESVCVREKEAKTEGQNPGDHGRTTIKKYGVHSDHHDGVRVSLHVPDDYSTSPATSSAEPTSQRNVALASVHTTTSFCRQVVRSHRTFASDRTGAQQWLSRSTSRRSDRYLPLPRQRRR